MPTAAVLKPCLPKNGMKWHHSNKVTRRHRIDARVVAGLRSLGVPIRKREVQIELTNLVEEATALARQVVSAPGRDIERSEFVRELGNHHRLGQVLPPAHFEQLFTTIVLARYRYRSDRWEDDLPEEDPANHCHLARAVDAFEAAAWFWSTPEAFLEDDHTRADEAERGASSSDEDAEEGGDRARGASSSAVGGGGPSSASIAAANDPAVASLAAGVDAMDLDDEVVGSEMEVDE